MSVIAEKKSWTYHDLVAEGLDPERYEIVNGEPVEVKALGLEGGRVYGKLAAILIPFVETRGLGAVYVASRFLLRASPRIERRPDIAFVSTARIPDPPDPLLFPGAPDLAVEVLSPSDPLEDATDKAEEYVACDARESWVVAPSAKIIIVFRPAVPARAYSLGDILESPAVLPGFKLPLEQLFTAPPRPIPAPPAAAPPGGP